MLLPLMLLLNPALAGPSRGARIAALEAQVAQLNADNLALAAQLEALQSSTAALERGLVELRPVVTGLESSQSETDELIETLLGQIADLRTALKATPKKARPDQHLALLDAEVKRLGEAVEALRARPAPAAPAAPSAEEESAASDLYKQANDQVQAGDFVAAKATLDQLMAQYGGTRSAARATQLGAELKTIGLRPEEPKVLAWFSEPLRMTEAPLCLVVFWESWCPHCKREVPRLSTWTERYGARGLSVLALTRITRTSTVETVRSFVEDNALPFAVAQEDGSTSEALSVKGIPAAAILKNGEVVWRGHPARIDEALLEKLLPAEK